MRRIAKGLALSSSSREERLPWLYGPRVRGVRRSDNRCARLSAPSEGIGSQVLRL